MKVGLVGNRRYAPIVDLLRQLAAAAPTLGVTLVFERPLAELYGAGAGEDLATADVDFILSLGGDGTLLRGARLACERGIPVLGINLGHLGFLASAGPGSAVAALERITRGDYTIDRRRALTVRIGDEGPPLLAVNDAVVHKGGVARVIRLAVAVDGEPIGVYSADGIIVASPTGSTAYSMSAGGPIVVPGVDALVITPICPHTLAVRPLVVSGAASITISVLEPVARAEELRVSLDGQATGLLTAGQVVTVVKAKDQVQLAKLEPESFYRRLRRKLAWGDLAERSP